MTGGALALYTDKPIYRHGDRVRFRLFASRIESQDQKTYGIEGEAFEIKLRRDGTTFQSVQARWDAFGGYSGEFDLPVDGSDWGIELSVDFRALRIPVVEHSAPRLELELTMPQGAIVTGDAVPLSVQVKRTSGEPLVGEPLSLVGRLHPQRDPLAQRFPGFRFYADDPDQDGQTAGCDRARALYFALERTDSNGISFSRLEMGDSPCEFYVGSVAVAPRELPGSRLSAPQTVILTRRARYLGLAGLGYHVQDPGTELNLRALAVDARSLAQMPGVQALIEVQQVDDDRVVKRCELLADSYADCDWTAADTGNYRIRLSASGFETSEFALEVADRGYGAVHYRRPPRLVLGKRLWQPGERVEMGLSQPYDQAQAVILVSDDQGLVDAQWQRLEQRLQPLHWQPPADLAGALRINVVVIPAPGSGPLERAMIEAAKLQIAPSPPQLFELELPAEAKPGDEVLVRIRSIHDQPLDLLISAYDDALSGLLPSAMQARRIDAWWAARTLPYPQAPRFRTLLQQYGCFELECANDTELFTVETTGGSPSGSFLDPDLNRPAADLQPRLTDNGLANISTGIPDGIRRHFASAFWWRSGELLQPGEHREFRVRLPDDLTRWRFEAVARNPQLAVQQLAATTDARQPLALQTDGPRYLYPGDRSRLSAALYCAMELSAPVEWEIQAPALAASTRRSLVPEPNQAAQLQLDIEANAPGSLRWWTRAAGSDTQQLSDGMLSALEIRDPVQIQTRRQIGLIPKTGIGLQADQLQAESSSGEITLSIGMDPLFGLGGVVAEALARDPWMPDNALDQLLSASLARKLGRATETAPFVRQAQQLLQKHRLNKGWIRYPGPTDKPDLRLSRRVLLLLAELEHAGVALAAPPDVDAEAIWQSPQGVPEYLPASTLAAQRLSWRWLSGKPTQQALSALLAEPEMTVEASARLSLFLADSDTHTEDLRSAQRRLREFLTNPADPSGNRWSALPSTAERCLALRALVVSDFGDDALLVQQRALGELYSAWGSTLPLRNHESIRYCLQAADAFATRWLTDGAAEVRARLGSTSKQATLRARGETLRLQQEWSTDQPISIDIAAAQSSLASYEIAFSRPLDLRTAAAEGSAIGIDRHYRLFRNGEWLAAGSAARVGDWIQVELQIRAAKAVSHAALVEALPGGLVAIDPTLEGGVDPRLAGESEYYWGSVKLGGTENRFLLPGLSPGLNKVRYLARVNYPGDYAWPGPRIELIYAPQVSARGAAERLEVGER